MRLTEQGRCCTELSTFSSAEKWLAGLTATLRSSSLDKSKDSGRCLWSSSQWQRGSSSICGDYSHGVKAVDMTVVALTKLLAVSIIA